MTPVRRAVIDIGTNSVKVLIGDVDGAVVVPVFEESAQTRLGQGFYETHQLQPENIAETARAVADFVSIAKLKEAGTIRIIATSAARDAVNQQDLVSAIESAAGLPLEVISGEQEAQWVYTGVCSDPRFAGHRLMILDVGGGSTEFVIGEKQRIETIQSFSIGSVRLLEKLKPSDPPLPSDLAACRDMVQQFFAREVHPRIGPVLESNNHPITIVGTGGAASILARIEFALDKYHRELIDGATITRAAIERWMERLWSLPLADRRRIIGLPKKRADVILTGAAIYEAVLREFNFTKMQTSTRGLRFAAVLQAEQPVAAE